MRNDFSYSRFGYECFLMQALPSGIYNIYGDTHVVYKYMYSDHC